LRVNDSIRILKKDEYKIVLLNEKNASWSDLQASYGSNS
jgi:hypothetical protein